MDPTPPNQFTADLTTDDPASDPPCIYCLGPYSKSRPSENWIQCKICPLWSHEECADIGTVTSSVQTLDIGTVTSSVQTLAQSWGVCRHWHSHEGCADIGTVMSSVQTLAQDLSSRVTSASDSSSLKKRLRYQYLFVFKQAQFACLYLSCSSHWVLQLNFISSLSTYF